MTRVTQAVTLTTAADGSATGYSEGIGGRVFAITYVKTDFATGVDFTITDENTAENLWTEINQDASITDYPRAIAQGVTGADLTGWYAEPVVTGRVKFVIAQGGSVKTGKFYVTFDA